MNKLVRMSTEYAQVVMLLTVLTFILYVFISKVAELVHVHTDSIELVIWTIFIGGWAYRQVRNRWPGYQWLVIAVSISFLMPALYWV